MTQHLELADVEWRRVSPKLIVAQLISDGIGAVVMLGLTGLLHLFFPEWRILGISVAWTVTIVVALATLIPLALTPRRVRAIGYQLRDDDLLFRRGILFQRFVAVPYGRMQLVDINRGPLSRALGLSELKFVTAAAATGVTIPGLPEAEADRLRDELVELAESRRAGL
jgi:uncharacterized protein